MASSGRVPERNDDERVRLEPVHSGDATGTNESDSQKLCDGRGGDGDFNWGMRLRSAGERGCYSNMLKRRVRRRRFARADISHV